MILPVLPSRRSWWITASLLIGWTLLPSMVWGAAEPPLRESPLSADWLSGIISRYGLGLGLLATLVGGLALNLTPCVYPMIPVTLAFFTSQGAGSLKRTAVLASFYVAGLSLNYALLGLIAARTGVLFGSWLQQPAVLFGVALVIVALALSMFGLYDLRLPAALTRRLGTASTGRWGAFLMGMVVGLIAAPCIGPFVVGLLLLVSHLANPVAGFFLFFMLGLGMGLPYLVLGASAHRIGQLPRAGPWLVWSKKVLGVVLLGLALYFVKPLLPEALTGLLVVGLLVGSGIYLGWLDRTGSPGRWFVRARWCVGVGLLVMAAAVAWPRPRPGPAVAWVPYSQAAFEQAQRDGRPILIDIYADWCLPCVEMDHATFRHPSVVQALGSVTTLRVDATTEVSADGEALLDRFHVYGAPTILFFDRTGREQTTLRLMGFEGPEEFLRRLEHIQRS